MRPCDRTTGKTRKPRTAWRGGAMRACLLAMTLAGGAVAAPQGGQITAGQGRISQPGADVTRIEQSSQTLSIDWQSFDVGAQETVRFVQPGPDAAALNRIFDQKPSEILGRIEADGRVLLMNPNGLIFGAGAVIDVGSLVATSLSVETDPLRPGEYRLAGDGAGAVVNRGVIAAASGGSVTLVGPVVRNEGRILADYGRIDLASGTQAYLSFDGASLLNFSVEGEVTANPDGAAAAVANSGTLDAEGGTVLLSASAASRVFSEVVNNTGLVSATRIENVGGVVTLTGSGGNVVNRGDIAARGEGGEGGRIVIAGERVGILDAARLDASGETGGGEIRIGARAGEGTATRFTQIAAGSEIRADAVERGDGGDIRVWAEDTTWAFGDISARGGAESGDGGFVEISARQGLSQAGTVDLGAPGGRIGTLLFDPTDIVVWDQADGAQADDAALPDLSDATVGAGSFNIGELALEGLASTANIILEATNDITINDLADNRLSLPTDSSASITITADSDGDGTGSFSMNAGDTLATNGGAIRITGASIAAGHLDANAAGGSGNISLSATGSISVGNVDAGTQGVSITVDSDANGAETLTLGGSLAGSAGVALNGGADGSDTLVGPNTTNAWTITALNAGTLNGADFTDFASLTGGSADDSFTFSGFGSVSGVVDGGAHTAGDSADWTGATVVVSVNLGSGIRNVETLTGGGADNTLIGDNVANTWTITGENDGTVGGVSFIDFANLTGGTGSDDFILSNGSVTGTIDGGGGNDSLTANDTSNTWSIQSADGGNVDGVFAFANIPNLIGGNGADIFLLNGGSVSGTIDGGAGNDALSGNNGPNTWNITGADAGSVNDVNAFAAVENLNGNADVDDFIFASGGSISGTVDGGAGNDSVDLSALADPVVADLSGSAYASIERFTGNNGDSTLIGPVGQNSWVIDGSNDGTLNAITFIDFTSLAGNSDSDSFRFSNGGVLAGSIDGGAGNDSLAGDNAPNAWDMTGQDAGTLNGTAFASIENLVGNADVDTFTFADGSGISGTVDGGDGTDTADFSAVTGTVRVQLGVAGFSNVETLTGNGTDSWITGESGINDWLIDGADSGSITTATSVTRFIAFNNLAGNGGDDRFVLAGGTVSGSIAGGGGGNDSLTADALDNTWTITGADSGSLTGVAAFSDIANLNGNSNNDLFVFADGSSISGTIDGGLGSDVVDHSAQTGLVSIDLSGSAYLRIERFIGNGANSTLRGNDADTSWTVTATNTGRVGSIDFVDFANLRGGTGADDFVLAGGNISGSIVGGSGGDSLTGDDITNDWRISGTDVGSLNGQNAFSEIEALSGGILSDTFTYADGSSFTGAVDGAGGNDTVDMSAQTGTVSITLGSGSFLNIENYIGNNIDSTLNGEFASNTWTVSGANAGDVNGIGFTGFNRLVGNVQTDTFIISSGSIESIDGGAGNDSLTAAPGDNVWRINTLDGGDVTNVTAFSAIENLIGNTGTDNFVFANTADISGTVDGREGVDSVDFSAEAGSVSVQLGVSGYLNIESFIGNDFDSTLTGPALTNNWQITGPNDGVVAGVSFTDFNNLRGNITSDTFIFSNGGLITGSVDGGTGLDTVDFSAVTGVVTVQLGGTGFTNIENFIGNGSASTLVGDDVANNWLITGVNDGSLGNVNFTDFNNIQGGSAVDSFTLSGGSITGNLDGGAGSDVLLADNVANTWNIDATDTGSVTGVGSFSAIENLQGNVDSDNFVFADGAAMSGVVDGGAGTDTVDHSAQTGAVVIALDGSAYVNVEDFVGNDIDSTLLGANSNSSWLITGPNSGSVGISRFSGFTRLQGNAQDDTFAIDGGSISGGIDGGAGSDSLTAQSGTNTWNLTGTDVGDLNGVTGFSDIENLIGNANPDRFVFANGASYSGVIDGGDGIDEVDHSSQAGPVTVLLGSNAYLSIESFVGNGSDSTLVGAGIANAWTLSGPDSGDVNGIAFRDFNQLSGSSSEDVFTLAGGSLSGEIRGGGGDDTLIGADVANTWSVSAGDSGSVTGVNAFSDIDNLVGGALADNFTLVAGLSGNLDGGAGDDTVTLAGSGASVGGIISGNAGNDTLRGPDTVNDWNLTGPDQGSLNGIAFQTIENLVGGTDVDRFSVDDSADAALSGGISAGNGDDTLAVTWSAASSRTLVFDGGAGNDTVSLDGGGTGFTSRLDLGGGTVSLTTSGAGQSQSVDVSGIETLQDAVTADRLTVNGSGGDDVLRLESGSLAGSRPGRLDIAGLFPLDFANKTDLVVDGGAGQDSLELAGDLTLDGDVTLSVEQIGDPGGARLGARLLTLDGVVSGGTAAAPVVTAVERLDLGGVTGSLYLREADGLALSAANVTGRLEVESLGGDITSNGAIVAAGETRFTVGDGGSILLTDAANDFALTPDFRSSGTLGSLSLTNTRGITLQPLTLGGDLNLVAGGDIGQGGALDVAGDVSIDAGTGGIRLDDPANRFGGSVALASNGSSDVSLVSSGPLTLAESRVGSGALSLSGEGIAQNGPLVQAAGGGAVRIDAGAGAITLDNAANDLTGTVSLITSGASDIVLSDATGLRLGDSSSAGGDITIEAGNGITTSGRQTSGGGDITLVARAGDIDLGHLEAGDGTITLDARTGAINGDVSPVTDPNLSARNLRLNAGTTLGDFNNPIAVKVPDGGTSLFVTGQGSAHIIGLPGTILPGSSKVNLVSLTVAAVSQAEKTAVEEIPLIILRDESGERFYGILDGGVRLAGLGGEEVEDGE